MHTYFVNPHKESEGTAMMRKVSGYFHHKKFIRMRVIYMVPQDCSPKVKTVSYLSLESAIKKAKSFIASDGIEVVSIMILDSLTGEIFWECEPA